jgi:uncharacterized Tic20 family protein
MSSASDRNTALWTHLAAILFAFTPLIMFLVKRDHVREHSRQGLNAMITNTICTFGAFIVFGALGFLLALVTFGFGTLAMYAALILPLVYPVFSIIAADKVEGYRFPLTIEFVK